MLPARIEYVRKALPVAFRILGINRQVSEDVTDDDVMFYLDGVWMSSFSGDKWQILREKHYPGTREIPPDMDLVVVENVAGNDDAAVTAFLMQWTRAMLEETLWSEMLTPEDL